MFIKHCKTALRKELLPGFLSLEDMLQAVLIVGALTSYHEHVASFPRHKHLQERTLLNTIVIINLQFMQETVESLQYM